MTVADLIRELQAMPQGMRVHVVTGSVTVLDIDGEYTEHLCDEDATEADEVRHMGPWVLIRGK
jgi:hypothetical protein